MKLDNRKIKVFDCSNGTGRTYTLHDFSQNRVLYHNKNGYMIISAMKGGFPVNKTFEEFSDAEKQKYREDVRKTNELKQKVRNAGLGYVSSLGGYPESVEGSDETIDVREFSVIIPRNPSVMDEEEFVEFGADLAKEYNQDSFLVAGISFIDDGQARYLNPNVPIDASKKYEIDPDFQFSELHHYNKLDLENRPYYTQIKKLGEKNFVYDEQSYKNLDRFVAKYVPNGFYETLRSNKLSETF